ncbi:hypothetical protein GQ44DRAFT_743365 [Phaeosphaeriaceae sp. PMI808]|nr:hypothetical protein GQ44DRAFT_743365 [Phaeosphaeriaceae sp. PMI808]
MGNPFPLTFFVTLLALSVSLVQSRVVSPQSISPAQSSRPDPALRTPSNNNLFTPDFYEFLKSGSVSTEGNNPDPRPSVWAALGDSFAAGPGAGDEQTPTYQAQMVRMAKSQPLHSKLAPAMSQRTL